MGLDVKKALEAKLQEWDSGYWKFQQEWARCGPLDTERYPPKIYGAHDKALPQFSKVQYRILGKDVSTLPSEDVIRAMHPFPSQVLSMMVDDKVIYSYEFPPSTTDTVWRGKIRPIPTLRPEQSEIRELYRLLYVHVCQCSCMEGSVSTDC